MTSTTKSYIRTIALVALSIFVLTGCTRKPNDAAIVSAIQSKLMTDPNLNGYYVHIKARNGVVTLTGAVPSAATKQAIDALASAAGKTAGFSDQLNVITAGTVVTASSDAAIENSVRQALAGDASLAKQNIEVAVNAGVVTLSGQIGRLAQKTQAEGLAREANGVKNVVDQLQVGAGSSSSATALSPTRPKVALKASPPLITPGKSALLTWSSRNAQSLDLEPGIGRVNPQGSRAVSPPTSTTYTLTATGETGPATASAHVTVWNAVPPPKISASLFPTSIQKGQSTRLSWTSQDATSVKIEPGVGRVGPKGSIELAPAQSTQYTLTATAQSGTQTTTALVTVTALPQPVAITISPGTTVDVVTIDPVDSGSNQPNDILRASLATPIQLGARLTLPQGTPIYLRVFEIHPGERSGRVSEVRLVLDHLVYRGRSYSLYSTDFDVFGLSHPKRNAPAFGGISRGLQVHIAGGARISFQLTQAVRLVLSPNGFPVR